MRKLPRLSATRKRKVSTSLRPYPSCLQAMLTETVITTPGTATPQTRTHIGSETSAMEGSRGR
eukprot:12756957-Ditylum_brightwellii.AAC.1